MIKDLETKSVLGLENSATIDNTDVIMEEKSNSMSQKWELVLYSAAAAVDAEGKGWFMLKNILSKRFLTTGDSKDLKIRGIYVIVYL